MNAIHGLRQMFQETVLKQIRATLIWASPEAHLLLRNRRSVGVFELMVSLQQRGGLDGNADCQHTACYNSPWRIAPFGLCRLTLPWKRRPVGLGISYHQGDEATISCDYELSAAFPDAWEAKVPARLRCRLAEWNPGAQLRALVAAGGYALDTLSRFSEALVLVLGKDTDSGLLRLRRIQRALAQLGYFGVLLKDLPDDRFGSRSIEEKAALLAGLASLTLIDDNEPAGQIAEMSLIARNRGVVAVLRRRGTGSTWLTSDYDLDFRNVAMFEYDEPGAYRSVVEAIDWGERRMEERRQGLMRLYPWR